MASLPRSESTEQVIRLLEKTNSNAQLEEAVLKQG